MIFDPDKHHRRSIRVKGYDYSLPGAYFVTLLTHRRACLFGDIKEGKMKPNLIGKMVIERWLRIPQYFDHTRLDALVLMPNHLHGIIMISDPPGKGEAFAETIQIMDDGDWANASPLHPIGTKPGSLSAIIQNFKSVSTRMVNERYFEKGNKIWQRNYFERVIRNEGELNTIRQYIQDNPINWELDQENPVNI